ncbi:hypothetical protein [Roseiflexus sp.]
MQALNVSGSHIHYSAALRKMEGGHRPRLHSRSTPPGDLIVLNDADPFLATNTIRGYRLYVRDAYQADSSCDAPATW